MKKQVFFLVAIVVLLFGLTSDHTGISYQYLQTGVWKLKRVELNRVIQQLPLIQMNCQFFSDSLCFVNMGSKTYLYKWVYHADSSVLHLQRRETRDQSLLKILKLDNDSLIYSQKVSNITSTGFAFYNYYYTH